MNHTIDKKSALEALAQKQRALNPPPPRPRLDAIAVKSGDRMLGGKIRQAGDILLVFDPEVIPSGFVTKAHAEELVESGFAAPATAEQIESFLDAQETLNTSDHQ